MRFSPDSKLLVIASDEWKKFQIISLTPELAYGEEQVENINVDDIIRQVNIVAVDNETLVYILHGKFWGHTVDIYSSDKSKEVLNVPYI